MIPGCRRQHNTGLALISVLLIVALVSALASHMITRHSLTIAHMRQLIYGSQAREYALGGEAYARQILFEDWSDEDSEDIDTLLETWSQPLEPFEVDSGELEIQIADLERRFNLNSVTGAKGPDNLLRLKRLMENLGLDPNLADAWLDWVDDDQAVHGFGAEDGEYLLADQPYRTANQPANDVSEMQVLSGITLEEYALIRPYVTLLPTDELKINMNTVEQRVLEALSPNFNPGDAEALVESAREYTDVPSITAQYAALGDSVDAMTVSSQYFEIRVRAEVSGTRAELTSIIHRDPTTGAMTLLSRDFGQRFRSLFVDEQDAS